MADLDYFASQRLYVLQVDAVTHLVVGPLQFLPSGIIQRTVCGLEMPDARAYALYRFMPYEGHEITCPECERIR